MGEPEASNQSTLCATSLQDKANGSSACSNSCWRTMARKNVPVICGTLNKRGYWNPSWKSRYFVLTQDGDLNYYSCQFEALTGGRRCGSIPIAQRNTPSDTGHTQETHIRARGQFYIEIDVHTSTPGLLTPSTRTYVLAADSRALRARWLAALHSAAPAWRDDPTDPPRPPPPMFSHSNLPNNHGAGLLRRHPPRRRRRSEGDATSHGRAHSGVRPRMGGECGEYDGCPTCTDCMSD
mmetsp:Transcript_43785/g.116956  ORF Transcript_43785/g.116956 Transcript_43785/m.116956 type:complete len:237 (+) Transcript_43785:142-852(+)